VITWDKMYDCIYEILGVEVKKESKNKWGLNDV